MPDEDAIEESGEQPLAVEEPDGAADAPEEAQDAPVTFTAEQLAEHLPQFQERFLAHHDPAEALALYGQRDRNVQAALTRYTQGAPTDEDVETLRESGYEIPEAAEVEEEPVEPLWGAPWATPQTWEEFNAIASERPWDAMKFIDSNPGRVNDETRQQVLNYWAEHDKASAIAYETQHARQQAVDEAKELLAKEMEQFRAEFGDVRAKHESDHQERLMSNATVLANRARTEVPDFAEHEDGVIALLQERANYDPSYLGRLFALPLDQQLQEINDLTGAAAWRNRPQAAAQAAADAEAAEAAKVSAGSERGRGNAGAPGTTSQQSEMKKKHLADIKAAIENPV